MPASKAHIVLDAVQFASEADLTSLTQLILSAPTTLSLELVLRILLTFLPESTEPSLYIPLLQRLDSGEARADTVSDGIRSPSSQISAREANDKIRKLKLLKLSHPLIPHGERDIFRDFLICHAYKIDAEIGSLAYVQRLIQPFIERYKDLAVWATSAVLPLLRLEQDGIEGSVPLSLHDLSEIHGRTGLETLLQSSKQEKGHDYSVQLRRLAGPWLLGQFSNNQQISIKSLAESASELQQWTYRWIIVLQWLLDLALVDYPSAVATYLHWHGPLDVDYDGWLDVASASLLQASIAAYQRFGLALIYVRPGEFEGSSVRTLIQAVAERAQLQVPEEFNTEPLGSVQHRVSDAYLSSVSRLHLSHGELLDDSNPLTNPSEQSLQYANLISTSANLLERFARDLSPEKLVNLALFDSVENQRNTCKEVVRSMPNICNKNDKAWVEAREQLLWLHDWNTGVQPGSVRQGIFSQVDRDDLHTAVLESLLQNGRYKLVTELYIHSTQDLPIAKVKDTLINVILAAYDNASNGNKTRGGIKKAAEMVTTFQGHLPGFHRLAAMWALIQATHKLSFYSLTLQHGVVLLPVNLRIHPEPLILIDRLLQQNPGSYTKLDDLLDIGKDLVKAGRVTFTTDEGELLTEENALEQVERAIIAKAIPASLAEDDFDTAYSYIVSRLSVLSAAESSPDDYLWQAAYEAGRYSSSARTSKSPSSLRRLEQRMELLSQAVLLAPVTSLQEVLQTWRDCERELVGALALESKEEDDWQAQGDRTLPGGFSHHEMAPQPTKAREHTRRAMDEEAPMGLFDVARGAAAALSKSAFPLRGQADRTSGEMSRADEDEPQQRVRKRDMVSNMVTGGLVSGIGWVIGAPPAKHDG